MSLTAARPDAPPVPEQLAAPGRAALDAPAGQPDLATMARADGIEFILALFVDLTGKPCAKLVPIEAVEELQTDGVGFAGLRRRRDGPGAEGPRPHRRSPTRRPTCRCPSSRQGLAIVHCDPHVEGTPWPYAPRVILREQLARAAELGLELKVGAEVEYFLVERGPDGALRPADAEGHRRAPLLRRPRPDPHVRPPHRRLQGDQLAGLGQLRQRPRGRQRAVRAELRLRRRADHRRPRRHPPVPALGHGRGARHDRDLHAQAVHRPHRQRPAHAPVAVARRRPGLPRRRRRRAAWACRPLAYSFVAGLLDHACGLQAVLAPDGQLLQAHRRHLHPLGRHLVPAAGDLRRQRPHPPAARPRRQPRRAARRRRLGQPLPRRGRRAGRRPGRHPPQPRPGRPRRATGSDPAAADPPARGRAAGGRPGRHAARSTPPAPASAATSPASSATSSSSGTARSPPGRSTAT